MLFPPAAEGCGDARTAYADVNGGDYRLTLSVVRILALLFLALGFIKARRPNSCRCQASNIVASQHSSSARAAGAGGAVRPVQPPRLRAPRRRLRFGIHLSHPRCVARMRSPRTRSDDDSPVLQRSPAGRLGASFCSCSSAARALPALPRFGAGPSGSSLRRWWRQRCPAPPSAAREGGNEASFSAPSLNSELTN